MSIPRADANASSRLNTNLRTDAAKAATVRTQAAPFSRASTAAATASTKVTSAAVDPTPFKAFATKLCDAGAKHRERLEARGVKNSCYLGSDKGQWVYSNPDGDETIVRHLQVKLGFRNVLHNFDNACIVRKDGRIIFDGEVLTKDHPQQAAVMKALEGILATVSEDKLPRHSLIGGNTRHPMWDPKSPDHHKYVD